MKSRIVFCTLVLATLGLAACGGHDDPPPFTAATDLESRLEVDTGVKWAVVREQPGAPPRVLGPSTPVPLPGASFEEKARFFFSRYGQGLGPSAQHALVVVDDRAEEDGSHDTAVAETLPGTDIPLFDSASSVRFDPKGNVQYVQSGLGVDVSSTATKPKVPEADALRAATEHVQASCGAGPTIARSSVSALCRPTAAPLPSRTGSSSRKASALALDRPSLWTRRARRSSRCASTRRSSSIVRLVGATTIGEIRTTSKPSTSARIRTSRTSSALPARRCKFPLGTSAKTAAAIRCE